jgi:hypothetical protein
MTDYKDSVVITTNWWEVIAISFCFIASVVLAGFLFLLVVA